MGYAQWVEVKLVNRSGVDLKIKDVYLNWGKLYRYPEKGEEVGIDTINGKTISNGSTFSFASCGRENASSGCEGELGLFDGNDQVMKVYWDCPWSGSNNFKCYYVKEGWFPSTTNWSTGGALGTVTVTLFKA